MEVTSGIITLTGMIITFLVTFVTMKNRQDSIQEKQIATDRKIGALVGDMNKQFVEQMQRLEKHGDDIVKLNTKSELAVTAKDVDDKYVSKEYFKQFEKHMDKRFDSLQTGQGKILAYIEGRPCSSGSCKHND